MENNTTECSNDSLASSQEDLILAVRSCIGGVGFCTCALTITLVFCLKLHKHFVYRLAMYKVTSSMLVNFFDISFTSFILEGHTTLHHVLCSAAGFLLMYFFWINVLFTLVIVFHFFSLAVCLKNFRRLEVCYVLFAVLFPLLFVWIPFINDNYGPTGGLCWIKDTTDVDCKPYREGIVEQYTLWYGPSYFILFICIVAAIIVIATLLWRGYCHQRRDDQEPLLNNTENKHRKAVIELIPLLAYPAIFLFFNVFAIAHRIVNAVPNISAKSMYKMELTHSIVMTSWGILSSMVLLLLMAITQSTKIHRKQKESAMSIQHTKEIDNPNATTDSSCANTAFLVPTESEVEREMQ